MKKLITLNRGNETTMTSLEISELVEKRHDNVKRTIETLASGGIIIHPQFEDEQSLDSKGRTRTTRIYLVDKRSSYIIVAQLSPEFTARLVDRWQDLEKAAQRPQVQIPTNFKESVQQLLLQIESNEQLTAQIESDRPKVELANAISASTKAIKIGAFAKVISNQSGFVIGEKNLFKWLRFEQIINNSNVPFQRYVDNGWFEMKQGTYEHKNTNGPQVYFTTMITGMGQTSIFKLFRKSQHSSRFLNKSARANRNGGYALFSKEATA